MFPFPLSTVRNVLCLGAHSDDIEIGCGGTLLELQKQSPDLNVQWIVFSSEAQRKLEAEKSAGLFLDSTGKTHVEIKAFSDRYFPNEWREIKDYFGELSDHWSGDRSPDLIFTHRLEDRHQDHRVIAELTWNAFRNHTILEYEIPKYEGDLGSPNIFVPLDEVSVNRKIEILMECFVSQQDHLWFDETTFRSIMRIRGLEINAAGLYAEAFTARKLLMR